jgi:DNA-binding SARP family transcriptional activator
MLYLRLFGDFELSDAAGASVPLPARNDQAVLTYLALKNSAIRDQLITMLWPDRAEPQARKSLRQSLVVLRRALNGAGEIIPADRRRIIALATEGFTVDAAQFRALASRDDLPSLLSAAELYQGGLLPHFTVRAPEFNEWLDGQRRRFADMAIGLYLSICEELLAEEKWQSAEDAARKLLAIDPLRENGHRLLMQALAGAGRRADALQQFHALSGLLRQELNVQPDADTVALYKQTRNSSSTSSRRNKDVEKPVPARPGVVMLPLRFGDDLGNADLAYGLNEEIIASLAAYKWFYVISAFQASVYKDKTVTPTDLALDLGVDYVLDGVLRRSGNRVRIRLNLSDSGSGELIWSETADCFFDETLDAQDSLARQVAQLIEPEILRGEDERVAETELMSMDAWHLAIRARRLADQMNAASLDQAQVAASQAITIAPDCAFGHAALAWTLWLRDILFRRDGKEIPEAINAAQNAVEIDPRFFLGHAALGVSRLRNRDYDAAEINLQRSISMNPSYPTPYNQISSCLNFNGKPRQALDYFEPLDRISPRDPYMGYYRCVRASTYFLLGDDAAAIENAQASLAEHPRWLTSEFVLAAACQRSGQRELAAATVRGMKEHHGITSIEELKPLALYRYDDDFELLAEQIAAAGMPP